MKKKILIILMALLLPAFVVVNSLASNKKEGNNNSVNVDNSVVIDSPLFTAKETYEKYVQSNEIKTLDNYEKVLQNENFKLYLNYEQEVDGYDCYIGAIAIENLKTGYIWRSDIVGDKVTPYDNYAYAVRYYDAKSKNDKTAYTDTTILTYKILDDSTLKFHVKISSAKIEFDYYIKLTKSGFDLSVPADSIVEDAESGNLIMEIMFFPNLGHAYQNSIPGYAFIPSGNGGLVRFEQTPANSKAYVARYYGADANIDKEESNILSLPVYGVTHGVDQNALFTRIKNGASIASLTYIPSSDITSPPTGYHRIYNTFSYRQPYQLKFASSIINMMTEMYETDVEVSYSFLSNSDANYVGMAKEYQRQLESENIIKRNSNSGTTNVHIDVLGGETEKGIVMDKYVKMTTTSQILSINDDLSKEYDNKFVYTLRGFNKDGYSRQSYSNLKFDSRLGNLNDLKGLDYYMYYNPVESYSSKQSYPNKVLVNLYKEKNSFVVEEGKKYKFYTGVDAVINGVNQAVDKYSHSVAIDSLGYRLYGDDNSKYTRTQVEEMYSTLLENKVPMFKPNEYLLGSTNKYLNMPLYHERLRFITDSVPFLQIALRGYIDYYSTYINFSTNQQIDLLKCVEYGSNLAYLISYEESYKLANTLSSHLYATTYSSNRAAMLDQIDSINRALADVKAQRIIDREVLETGVIKVTYENGTDIYVNYTNEEYVISSNKVVLPMSFEVVA